MLILGNLVFGVLYVVFGKFAKHQTLQLLDIGKFGLRFFEQGGIILVPF
jgi:hypothetical protein